VKSEIEDKEGDIVEKTTNPITVTVFGKRQDESCWSGG
jgi:hypothetical protein